MKKLIVYYKVASYILIVIAGILSLVDVFSLLIALANPIMLLSVFILTGVIIYSFASFTFFTRSIQNGRQCKPNLKDWIKVNAYVSIAFGLLVIVQNISFFSSPANMNEVLKQVNEMQRQMKTPGVATSTIMSTFKTILYFMVVYALLLLAHIFMTFRLLKENNHLFGDKPTQD